jgi:allophanate hydrolase subunit 2
VLADHPLTGGYPVVAVLREDDADRAAQARPGQALRLRAAGAHRCAEARTDAVT